MRRRGAARNAQAVNILAFDTALAACSAALLRDGAVAAARFAAMERGHAEALLPMLESVLREAGETLGGVDAIAVTVGPGHFTGIRIGLAAARGLALALARPCLGVTTLEAVAHGSPAAARGDRALLVALETKRADVYAQLFAPDLAPLGEPAALLPEEIPRLLGDAGGRALALAGDAGARVVGPLAAAGLSPARVGGRGVPEAAVVGALAAGRLRAGESPPPTPLYLRPPDAALPVAGGRLRP
jgi:tRNA threonylcarbamoyladenosine biosynthesis protein TsaB